MKCRYLEYSSDDDETNILRQFIHPIHCNSEETFCILKSKSFVGQVFKLRFYIQNIQCTYKYDTLLN